MLMLVSVVVGFAEILFRVLVESLLTAERAEVESLPVVFGFASSGRGVNVHAADGVFDHVDYPMEVF